MSPRDWATQGPTWSNPPKPLSLTQSLLAFCSAGQPKQKSQKTLGTRLRKSLFSLKQMDANQVGDIRHFAISHNASYLPLKILHSLCFSFLLGITAVPREIENKGYAEFLGQTRCITGNVEVAYCFHDLLLSGLPSFSSPEPLGLIFIELVKTTWPRNDGLLGYENALPRAPCGLFWALLVILFHPPLAPARLLLELLWAHFFKTL